MPFEATCGGGKESTEELLISLDMPGGAKAPSPPFRLFSLFLIVLILAKKPLFGIFG